MKVIELGEKNEVAAALEAMRRELPQIAAQVSIIAQIRRANYNAHIERGFTPEQALELYKTVML